MMHREGTHRHVAAAARCSMYVTVSDHIQAKLPETVTSLCKETTEARKRTGICGARCNCL